VVQPIQPMVETSKFKGTLLEHQQKGVKWALDMHAQGVGQVLGDEPGLGRTVNHPDQGCMLLAITFH